MKKEFLNRTRSWGVPTLLACVLLSLPANAEYAGCQDEGLPLLAPPGRGLATLPVDSLQRQAAIELRFLLPETGRIPTVAKARAEARGLLGGTSAASLEGISILPPGKIGAWRAGEIYDALRRAGMDLTTEEQRVADAYARSREYWLTADPVLKLPMLTTSQRDKVQTVLKLLRVNTQMVPEGISIDGGTDSIAQARAYYVLAGLSQVPPKKFTKALSRSLDALDDLIASRATPREIADAPFIYRRWDPRTMQGEHALRGTSTRTFRDPMRRTHVIEIDENVESTRPKMTEVLQISALADGGEGSKLRGFERMGEKEHQDVRKCVACHRVRGGLLFSLTKSREGASLVDLDGHTMEGRGDPSFFVSSNGLRESGMAKPMVDKLREYTNGQ